MNERYEAPRQGLDYNVDLDVDGLRHEVELMCSLIDEILEHPTARSLQFARMHADTQEGVRIEKDRHHIYEEDGVSTSFRLQYECRTRYDAELYDLTVTRSARFPDGYLTRPSVISYRFFRVNDSVKEAQVTARYHVASYDSDKPSIQPVTRPIMLGDLNELWDICDTLLKENA